MQYNGNNNVPNAQPTSMPVSMPQIHLGPGGGSMPSGQMSLGQALGNLGASAMPAMPNFPTFSGSYPGTSGTGNQFSQMTSGYSQSQPNWSGWQGEMGSSYPMSGSSGMQQYSYPSGGSDGQNSMRKGNITLDGKINANSMDYTTQNESWSNMMYTDNNAVGAMPASNNIPNIPAANYTYNFGQGNNQ